jgi:tetratricopeptide (TPR) repeat protein
MLSNLGAVHEAQGDLAQAQRDIEAALAVARDIGDVRLESFALCNLGLVALAQQQWAAARTHFEAALDLARRVQERSAEGQFLGYLGLLHARQREFESARRRLEEGATLLREVADRPSLGLLLCQRAELELLAGDSGLADTMLRDAGAIAAELGAGADSEIGRGLTRVTQLIEAAASPPTLRS